MALLRGLSRAAATGTAILSFAAVVAAQAERPGPLPQGPQPDVVSLLQSRDPRLEAWGAWYAGVGQLRQLAPLLEDVVRTRLSAGGMNPTLDIALDALIQLRAPLDDSLLADVYAVRPAQALIVASFSEDSEEFLDSILQSATGHQWFAAANLMIQRSPHQLAAHVLSGLRLILTVYVVDAGSGGGSGGGGVALGCGVETPAPGMPPWATYRLTSFPASGLTILALGPTPVYYARTVAPAGQSPVASVLSIPGPTADDRVAYAAAAAHIPPPQVPLAGHEQRFITVARDEDLANEVARVRADLARRYDMFLRTLVGRGVLSEDAAKTYPVQIEVEVVDRRTK